MQQPYSKFGLLVIVLAVLAVVILIVGFEWMWKMGNRLARSSPH
jgi:uncharacterized membrane protein affecting hemolysin expression